MQHCTFCGGAAPKPEYYQWDPEGKDLCVLCAINNLFQTLGGEYTAEEFGQYIDTLRAEKGLEPLGLRSWFHVEDIIESVFDKSIVRRLQKDEQGNYPMIFDDESCLIWKGRGKNSHLMAISDGWLFDSHRHGPLDLLSYRRTLQDGLTAMYTINKDAVNGIWLLDVPSKSKSLPLPVAQFVSYAFLLKEARTLSEARKAQDIIDSGADAILEMEAERLAKRSVTREWLAAEKAREEKTLAADNKRKRPRGK